MRERDAIYAIECGGGGFLHAAELEARYAEYGGYTSEARAASLLHGLGWRRRSTRADERVAPVGSCGAPRAGAVRRSGHSLADERADPTIWTSNSIRWLEDVLNQRHEHDGDHLARPAFSLRGCTHMADVDYGGIKVYRAITTTT